MSLSNSLLIEVPNDSIRQRLEFLYARRRAVNNLIRSLEAYSTCEDPLAERIKSRGAGGA